MNPVEVLALVPLLIAIIFLNAVLVDSLSGELEELKELDEISRGVFSNTTPRVNWSLIP